MPRDSVVGVRLPGTDARELTVADGAVDLTFFSPPYVSALDYPRVLDRGN